MKFTFNKQKIIDISVPVKPVMACWPGSEALEVRTVSNPDKGTVDSTLTINAHAGSHVDVAAHFLPGGLTIDEYPIDRFCGPVEVVELYDEELINEDDIVNVMKSFAGKGLFFKTDNSNFYPGRSEFKEKYTALDVGAAQQLVKSKVEFVGIDYLSIEPFNGGGEVHRLLLGNDILIFEGLDLSQVNAGKYFFTGFPLKLEGLEASPVRAVLMKEEVD